MASAKSDYGFQHGLRKFLSNVKYLLKYRPTAKRDPKSKLVLIISFPRSGTHALASMINHDKIGMHYYGEFFIFNQWSPIVEYLNKYIPFFSWRYFLNTRRQKRHWQHYRFEQTTLDPFNTIERMMAFPGTHIIKIFPEHLHLETLKSLIKENHPHILILRRNHLDRYISL
ncbi:MAG: sulfotransferase domain-containing protein, partial [Candidatus Nanopelagicaceae bacterium]